LIFKSKIPKKFLTAGARLLLKIPPEGRKTPFPFLPLKFQPSPNIYNYSYVSLNFIFFGTNNSDHPKQLKNLHPTLAHQHSTGIIVTLSTFKELKHYTARKL